MRAIRDILFQPVPKASHQDWGLLLARIGFAGLLIWRHGIPKLPAFAADPVQFFDPLGLGPWLSLVLATFAEIVCALALGLGIFSRPAALLLMINFGVIVFVLHQAGVPGDRGELAFLFLIAFSVLFLTGPGRYSVDQYLKRTPTPDD